MSKKCKLYKNEPLELRRSKTLFKILPFHNVVIQKPKIRGLKNIDLLQKLPFYDELSIYEMSKAFGWHARSITLK